MNIIPELNLNKHPNAIKNNSIVYADNIMLSKDTTILQNENDLKSISESIFDGIFNDFRDLNIIYAIPCNKEIIFFNAFPDDTLWLIRYDEQRNEAKVVVKDYPYHNGTLIGTFTYNKNDLIIAISEYDANIDVPLKTINLGSWENVKYSDSYNHALVPEIIIPTIKAEHIEGLAYKGWYYIFVRYKINNDDYTQWYNTNESIFIDDFSNKNIINYLSYYKNNDGEYNAHTFTNNVITSTDADISQITFKCIINNIDTKYKYYQLGFINSTKTSQKAFKTIDLATTRDTFIFDNKVETISLNELLKSYYNYYNVKTLDTINNKLYIANYKEKPFIIKDELINVRVEITSKVTDLDVQFDDVEITNITKIDSYLIEDIKVNYSQTPIVIDYQENGKIYKLAGVFAKYFYVTDLDATTPIYKLLDTDENDTLYISYSDDDNDEVNKQILSKNLIYVPELGSGVEKYGYYEINNGLVNFLTNTEIQIAASADSGSKGSLTINNDDSLVRWHADTDTNLLPINSIKLLNTNGIMPNEKYKFYIHFVDKYGESTLGYDISSTRVSMNGISFKNGYWISNKINSNQRLEYDITISGIPIEYEGAFISYEKFETNIKYKGIIKINNGVVKFYNDSLNYLDSISFDITKVDLYNITISESNGNKLVNIDYDRKTTFDINNKQLLVADSLNNILEETSIYLNLNGSIADGEYYAVLYNENELYQNINKQLIPASNIGYKNEKGVANVTLNTKNSFSSISHAIIYPKKVYFDEANFEYKIANKTDNNIEQYPAYIYKFIEFFSIPNESLSFNNKPVIKYFPLKDSNGKVLENGNSFVGSVVDIQNTIDLFKQNQNTNYDAHPKTHINYLQDKKYSFEFNTTFRRSNVIQDESNVNAWRQFEVEQYRNINENKGSIVKLVGIGKYFIVHTEHSMFLFNGTDTIKSEEGGIQLASVDILNLNYQEIVTSKLGYAGLQKENHGIVGTFGYIFYSKDDKRFYRYDNDKLYSIDDNIINFIQSKEIQNVILIDDKYRNRLLIKINNQIIISYNYITNTFISKHTYSLINGYSTKNNTYILTQDANLPTDLNIFTNMSYRNASISIIHTTNYELMKYLDNIIYKVNQINNNITVNTESPVEGKDIHYAGDMLQIYSEHCNTGIIDIDTSKNLNSPDNYMTPYWRFGNWHFNAIRDKITDNTLSADKKSKIFGNWFVVKFNFDTDQKVEIESLECKTSIAEY